MRTSLDIGKIVLRPTYFIPPLKQLLIMVEYYSLRKVGDSEWKSTMLKLLNY